MNFWVTTNGAAGLALLVYHVRKIFELSVTPLVAYSHLQNTSIGSVLSHRVPVRCLRPVMRVCHVYLIHIWAATVNVTIHK